MLNLTLTLLTTLATLGGLLSLPTWGALSDRFGNKPVLMACAFLWAVVGLASWSVAGPHHYLHLFLNYFFGGGATAGFQLCQFNLMVGLVGIAQVMFTPRRLSRFAEESLRKLRRQTADLTEVGEELVDYSWRAIKQPFSREDHKPDQSQK